MSHVPIRKAHEIGGGPLWGFESMQSLFDEVRKRAFELFQQRGATPGWDLDDWFHAERELPWSPHAELIEKEKEFQVRIAAPGLDANDIQVTVTPESIIAQAEADHKRDQKEGVVRISEFTEKQLFRRFDLLAKIDVDKVTATVDKGLLRITAAKAVRPKEKKITVAAA